nr:MAG TPA: Protein of unknown function (DUF2829) [Caudoviricetes sp.]
MCDVGMKEAIEKLVKAIEIASLEVLKPKTVTVNPFLYEPIQTLKFNTEPMYFKSAEIEPETITKSEGITVNSEHGAIKFDCDGLSFDFGVALENIKKGVKVCRKGWNGKGMYVKLEKGGDYEFSEINPFFVIKNTSNSFNTWVPSVSDLLATDWTIYIGE